MDLLSRCFGVLLFVGIALNAVGGPQVLTIRTPNGGIQPQAAIDTRGTIHLVYFKGEQANGDLFYVTRHAIDNGSFSKPLQVNRQPGSAIAVGTIRGAQMALGRNGRVHVAWNGHAPKGGTYMDAPMLYTRLNDDATAFEPERDVITSARGLDGGGSITADNLGNVCVFWHAPKPGSQGEQNRAVFFARSTNDGYSFAAEKLATEQPTGACGCCGMKALATDAGNIFVCYRSASTKTNRDETLLLSRNFGATFEILETYAWTIATCPMSSASLSTRRDRTLAAAEMDGRVFFVGVDHVLGKGSTPVSPDGRGKHPVVVENDKGDILMAWTEGTGWNKGGAVVWQLYDRAGKPRGQKGRANGVPVWSLISAVPTPDGDFVVIY